MNEVKQAHAGNELYDENFYRAQKDGSYKSASMIVPVVRNFVHPKTVIDIGCGVGTWPAAWQNMGVQAHGIDGDYVDRSQLVIDAKFFHPGNLEERITANKKFDLAETLEVAEHLTPERADTFVEDLTKLSDIILFSAAIPYQGGTNHVNEQWPSYWVEKFLKCGYVCIDCIRPKIWENHEIPVHYRQNIFIYAKSTELYRYPELQKFYLEHRESIMYDSVHPELWVGRTIYCQNIFNELVAKLQQHGGGGIG